MSTKRDGAMIIADRQRQQFALVARNLVPHPMEPRSIERLLRDREMVGNAKPFMKAAQADGLKRGTSMGVGYGELILAGYDWMFREWFGEHYDLRSLPELTPEQLQLVRAARGR